MTRRGDRLPAWAQATVEIVRDTYASWRDARTMRLGAGIAYYALFALVPLLTLSVVFAQLLVPDDAVADFFEKLGAGLNIEDEAVQRFIDQVTSGANLTSLGLIGFGSLLFTAGIVFVALQDAFDEMWEYPVERDFLRKIRRRLVAFLVVGGGGVIIVLALAINAVSGLIARLIPGDDTVLDRVPDVFEFLSGWAVLIGGLAIVYQVLTRDRIRLVALGVGSVAAAGLLAVGTQVLALYLTNYASASLTGALGSVFLVLLWLYYVAQMVLVGGHLIRTLNARWGPRPQAGST